MASSRAKGDEGELWVQARLQAMLAGCGVVSTARVGQSGDLRLDAPVSDGITEGVDDLRVCIEVKNHKDSVARAQARQFTETLSTPTVAWADVALFVSVQSNIHGHPDFAVQTLADGRECCFISCVMAHPERLEAAVRLVLARAQFRRRHHELQAASANLECLEAIKRSIDCQQGTLATMYKMLSSLTLELAKAQSEIDRMSRLMAAPACNPHEAAPSGGAC